MPPASQKDPEAALVALFRNHALPNEAKSIAAGRPIADDVEVCEIRRAGSRDFTVQPAHAFADWVNDPYLRRQISAPMRGAAQQYRQFKAQETQTKAGTPLDYAAVSEPRRGANSRR
jgi:hypothetical protein